MTDGEMKILLNQVLKGLFYKILRIQEKSVSKSSNNTLSRTEMHIMESIQESSNATLTSIADELGITKATASVSLSRLVEKNYVRKIQFDKDKRMSILKLTDQGAFCCKKHEQFHDMMVESLLNDFHIGEYPELLRSFQSLIDFFEKLEKT